MRCVLLRSAVLFRALLCRALLVYASFFSVLCCALHCCLFCSCSILVLFCALFCGPFSAFSFLFQSVPFYSAVLCCITDETGINNDSHHLPLIWRRLQFFFNLRQLARLAQKPVHRHFAWFLQSGTSDDFEFLRPGPLYIQIRSFRSCGIT